MILRITQQSVLYVCQISVIHSYYPVDICVSVTAVLTHSDIRLTTVPSVELHSELCYSSELSGRKEINPNEKLMYVNVLLTYKKNPTVLIKAPLYIQQMH